MTRLTLHETKTDPELLELLEKARTHVMTPEERRAQMISWVAGELGIENPELTEEQCRQLAESAYNRWRP
jgi:thioester reductase-like protein